MKSTGKKVNDNIYNIQRLAENTTTITTGQ